MGAFPVDLGPIYGFPVFSLSLLILRGREVPILFTLSLARYLEVLSGYKVAYIVALVELGCIETFVSFSFREAALANENCCLLTLSAVTLTDYLNEPVIPPILLGFESKASPEVYAG